MKTIAVYGASGTQIDEKYFDNARRLGTLMAENGMRLVNGAGNMGLMKASADACLDAGGQAVGVIPQFMVEQNWHHQGMTELIVTKDMHERKATMAQMADGCVALPGGCGTFEELLEVLTWKQLGLYLGPIVIMNVDGYYDPLIEMLQRAADDKFMRQLHLKTFCVATTAEEAIHLLQTTPKWNPEVGRYEDR